MAWEELTDYEKGYIAAFLDGEGTISVTKHNTVGFQLRIAFYNTHKETINWIAESLGEIGIMRTQDTRCEPGRNKDNYAVFISKYVSVYKFLVQIMPYLKIKKEQAKLGIKFMETVLNRNSWKYTKEDKEKMKLIGLEISNLNKGGIR